jgi:flagellar biosynthesis protein FlhF
VVAAGLPVGDQRMLEAMRFELHGLRELIEVQLGSIAWGQLQTRKPQQANLWRRLQRMGIAAELARALLEKVATITEPRQAWRMVLAHLAHAIRTAPVEPLEEGGVIALVGPAGMGKTTTLAKLAARYVLKYGAQNIALVSMDSYRIGAQEQLKTLGRILNVSVTHVDPGQSLTQALVPLARRKVVLIDTAGLPGNDPALRMQLETLAGRGIKAKNYLVLAATSQSQVLKAAYHSYKHCGLAGCILTKLDEATSLGEVLGLAISQRLPVAYVADGPRIPDDLQLPRSHQLVSRAVSLQVPEDPSEDAMADMFAGLYQQQSRQVG